MSVILAAVTVIAAVVGPLLAAVAAQVAMLCMAGACLLAILVLLMVALQGGPQAQERGVSPG